MNDAEAQNAEDRLIEAMIEAKEAPAVLKYKLISLRSVDPTICIFAFEGIDDKIVYFHWVKRIAPDFVYEPFICDGKSKVLRLKAALERDLGGLGKGVFFFVDRDFDDLRGHQASSALFMTDSYSFENYLVNEGVFEELLKNEYHCHAEPACRVGLLTVFKTQYEKFLSITKEANFRLFVARKLQIELTTKPPARISGLAKVFLSQVEPISQGEEPIKLTREPTKVEMDLLAGTFENLGPRYRYRGKFAILFFRKWLELLAADRGDVQSVLFGQVTKDGLQARTPITLDSMAARSALPTGLREFVEAINTSLQVTVA